MKGFPFDQVPGFTPELQVGALDRGMGRMDFSVIIRGGSFPIAKLEALVVTGGVPGNFRTQALPAMENALLFAAAPELYGACKEAYVLLQAFRDVTESASMRVQLNETMAKLEAAMRRAVPPLEEDNAARPHVHRPDCGNHSGCNCSVDWDSMR